MKKRKEMEMYMTYQMEAAKQENLTKMISQHTSKVENIQNKIQNIIKEDHAKLEERIKTRRLRSQSARSRSIRSKNEDLKGLHMPDRRMQSVDIIKEQGKAVEANQGKARRTKRKYSEQIRLKFEKQKQRPRKHTVHIMGARETIDF